MCKWLLWLPLVLHLYAYMHFAKHMRWHDERASKSNFMCHPFDIEAYKYFKCIYFDFIIDPSNINFSLCVDGFI